MTVLGRFWLAALLLLSLSWPSFTQSESTPTPTPSESLRTLAIDYLGLRESWIELTASWWLQRYKVGELTQQLEMSEKRARGLEARSERAEQRARDNELKWKLSEQAWKYWQEKSASLRMEVDSLNAKLLAAAESSQPVSDTLRESAAQLRSFRCPSPPWWQELGKIALSAGGGYALCKLTG